MDIKVGDTVKHLAAKQKMTIISDMGRFSNGMHAFRCEWMSKNGQLTRDIFISASLRRIG